MTTVIGDISICRTYRQCPTCGESGYWTDHRLGIDHSYTRRAREAITLAGASWSFAAASEHLARLSSLRVSGSTIRRICEQQAADIQRWQAEGHDGRPFSESPGNVEFQTDGTTVNTTDGWREIRLAVLLKRLTGESVEPALWQCRQLPEPSAWLGRARLETADEFAADWSSWLETHGLHASEVTVLADGAEWIWRRAQRHLTGAEQVLDIYHAAEHLAEACRAIFGEGTPAAQGWFEAGRHSLLSGGWHGLNRWIGAILAERDGPVVRSAVESLITYFSKHVGRLNYADRLARGRSIGSGAVEGAAKRLVGRRLKQTGARWLPRHAQSMANTQALLQSGQWSTYWMAKT